MASTVDRDKLLRRYLQHHWLGARAGLSLFRRVAGSASDPEHREQLSVLADEVAEDRESLRGILTRVGAGTTPVLQGVAVIGERAGRLKTNGSLTQRTELTDLLELEALATAAEGKKRGWLGLLQLAPGDDRLDADQLRALVERADEQITRLDSMHQQVAARGL